MSRYRAYRPLWACPATTGPFRRSPALGGPGTLTHPQKSPFTTGVAERPVREQDSPVSIAPYRSPGSAPAPARRAAHPLRHGAVVRAPTRPVSGHLRRTHRERRRAERATMAGMVEPAESRTARGVSVTFRRGGRDEDHAGNGIDTSFTTDTIFEVTATTQGFALREAAVSPPVGKRFPDEERDVSDPIRFVAVESAVGTCGFTDPGVRGPESASGRRRLRE